VGWISDLPPELQHELTGHFLEMIELRLALSEEETIVPMEIAMQDSTDPIQAAEVFRTMAASQRRQEGRIGEMAEHVEAVVQIIEDHLND
jgi:hypothetical protein